MTRLAKSIAAPRAISPSTRVWFPGRDGSGNALDQSGNGFTLTPAAGNNEAWAQAGYVQSKATSSPTDGSLAMSLGALSSWDSSTQSLLLAVTIKAPSTPAASRIFGTSTGGGATVAERGFNFATDTSGYIGLRLNDGSNLYGASTYTSKVVLDDAPHAVFMFLDCITRKAYMWADDTVLLAAGDFASVTGPLGNATAPLLIGRGATAATVPTRKVAIRNLQIVTVTGRLPANYLGLIQAYRENPFRAWDERAIA